jgi:hypothetical protein
VWHSLYLQPHNARDLDDAAAVKTALVDVLQKHGYTPYDPFAGGTGTPPGLKTFVRHFVAPMSDGWVRILGQPDLAILSDLSTGRLVLHAWINEDDSGIEVYRSGHIDEMAVKQFQERLTLASPRPEGEGLAVRVKDEESSPSILPVEIQHLARDHNVSADQANKMIDRVTSRLFGKMDRASGGEASAVQAQARALVTGTSRIDWNSPAAQQLATLARKIPLPANWRTPDFDAVRDAYQAARMLHKNPRAQLLPDERAALNAIPNAIQYEAVYVGK